MTPSQPDSLLILVCTYNERDNLPLLFEQMETFVPGAQILVVDDNSPDGTSDWVEEQRKKKPNLALLRRSGKLGLGSAIKAGMEYAIQNGFEWLLNLDADLSHSPSDIPALLAQRNQFDIVVGSRYVEGGGMRGCSWKRVFVSQCANAYARRMIGWKVQDCSSAFRLYRVSSLQRIEFDELRVKGYGFLEEVLWFLLHSNARLAEVGIVYTERREGKSKISVQEAWSAITSIHRVASLQRKARSAG